MQRGERAYGSENIDRAYGVENVASEEMVGQCWRF
jgi:hypothetical protein